MAVILSQAGPALETAAAIASQLALAHIIEVPDREAAKELTVVGDIYDQLLEFNLGRHDTIVGVGGGAVTDVAGFVAATWLRGVEAVLVPTTLLAAVDASIGGKTGINRGGKNLVGSFWHPSRVVVDLDVLDRLPEELRLEGSAEIIKAGFVADARILGEYRERGPAARLDEVVPRAIAVKAEVVTEDFREMGRRAILNFGHTIGHAVEVLAPMPHGLAVAVGMAAAAHVSAQRYGFDEVDLTTLLRSCGLPTSVTGLDVESCLDLIRRDKKRTAEGVRMVLLRGIADPTVAAVTEGELVEAIGSIISP